jgi:hypothetical protein
VLTIRDSSPADGQEATLAVTARVDGEPITSEPIRFTRGTAPVSTPVPATPAPAASAASSEDGGSAFAPAAVIAAIVAAAVVLALVLWFVARRLRESRAQGRRDRQAGRKSDQPLPGPVFVPSAEDAETVTASLVPLTDANAGVRFDFGDVPLIIGSDPDADVRLATSRDIAPRHATIRVRGGRITLRHTGGARPTLVNGVPVEVVILEHGDEFTIGGHRFRAELSANGAGPEDGGPR